MIIYPTRSIEQSDIHPHRSLLNGEQVHRVYLDELGDIRQLPLWVALMVLTTTEESQAPEEARYLLSRTRQEVPSTSSRSIIEILTAIMVYKFQELSQTEVESMLGITLEQTRVYREIMEKGQQSEAAKLIIRLMSKRIGQKLPEEMVERISGLPLSVLEDLSEALLDFTTLADLQAWLENAH
jgi:predicted transposase YdaD